MIIIITGGKLLSAENTLITKRKCTGIDKISIICGITN